jgi:hypothetical protein
MIAGPFFAVYMLKSLQMPYAQIAIFSAITTISSIATNPMWGYLADKFGHKPVLRITSFCLCLVPLVWVFASRGNYWFVLPPILVWGGTVSAGLVLSEYNLMLKTAPAESRSVYIGCYSALVSAASAVGAMLGGALADAFAGLGRLSCFGYPISNIQCLFLVSGLCRLASLSLLAWVREEQEVAASTVIRQVRSGRPLMAFWNLLRMARSSDPARKAEAAEALGSTGSTLAVDELIGLLEDSDREVRREAARALGEIGDARAVQPLIAKTADPLADIVEDAVAALGRIRSRESLDALLVLLGDQRDSVRKSAALALGALADSRAREPLEALLDRERDPAAFLATADALSALGSHRAIHRLRAFLRNSSPGVARRRVANAIGNLLGPPGRFYALLQADEMRQEDLVGRILTRARRRLRARIPGMADDREHIRRELDATLRYYTHGQYAEAVARMHDVASRAMRRFARSRVAEAVLAGQRRGYLGDLRVQERVGLLLRASDRLRLNLGPVPRRPTQGAAPGGGLAGGVRLRTDGRGAAEAGAGVCRARRRS